MRASQTDSPTHPLRDSQAPLAWRWVGERGLRLETGAATLNWYAALHAQGFDEVEDLIPADGTLLLVLRRGAEPSPALRAELARRFEGAPSRAIGRRHDITVDYGGAAGPDLPALAARLGLDVDAYVCAHAAAEYTVAFLGFQPGFPYLAGLSAALRAPRRQVPRTRVAAGSVAIGGAYTGIYPEEGPGGWHIIGRAHVNLFEPSRAAPALLAPGDRVRFIPK